MQPKGQDKKTLLAELQKLKALDPRYEDGRILCSMCTKPHSIAQKAYRMFLDSNLGDSGLFRGSAQIEKNLLTQLTNLLNGKDATGLLVSGGTEANLVALLAARNKAKVDKPELVLPQSAHFSFNKICRLLNIKPVYAGLDSKFRVDTTEVEKLVNENTVALVGSAGTAELGVVDPIRQLSEIAQKKGVWLHVDAAFGGLVIPFLKEKYTFDFSLDGVNSMTVDPHKMGLAVIPAGSVLFRETALLEYVKTETPYLSENAQYTFVGTRTGAAAASAYAVMKALGREGFQKIVSTCMKNTFKLAKGLESAGFTLLTEPTLNVIAFRSQDTKDLAQKLWKKGWFVSYVPRYNCIRIVVMPHVKHKHIVAFLDEVETIENL